MLGRIVTRPGPALALVAVMAASPSAAGGMGRGAVMLPAGGMHGGAVPFHGMQAGSSPRWGGRGLPPLSGIIHERPGMRSYVSGVGHTGTESRFGGSGGWGSYGHTATALPMAGAGRMRFGGYGHTATALPAFQGGGRLAGEARGFRRFAGGTGGIAARFGRGRLAYGARGYRGYGVGGYGGYGVGAYGGYGVGGYGGSGTAAGSGDGGYGAAGADGYPGGAGVPGAADPGIYGGAAIGTAPGTYGGPYISETPLAARFAEAPLAPSPGSAYSPDDAYAYAASADSGPGPRIVTVGRGARPDCRCGVRVAPVVYRYGVGTAY